MHTTTTLTTTTRKAGTTIHFSVYFSFNSYPPYFLLPKNNTLCLCILLLITGANCNNIPDYDEGSGEGSGDGSGEGSGEGYGDGPGEGSGEQGW